MSGIVFLFLPPLWRHSILLEYLWCREYGGIRSLRVNSTVAEWLHSLASNRVSSEPRIKEKKKVEQRIVCRSIALSPLVLADSPERFRWNPRISTCVLFLYDPRKSGEPRNIGFSGEKKKRERSKPFDPESVVSASSWLRYHEDTILFPPLTRKETRKHPSFRSVT